MCYNAPPRESESQNAALVFPSYLKTEREQFMPSFSFHVIFFMHRLHAVTSSVNIFMPPKSSQNVKHVTGKKQHEMNKHTQTHAAEHNIQWQ